MQRKPSFTAGNNQILDAYVSKGTAHHYLMVATASAIAVEILLLHAARQKIFPRGGSVLYGACRTDLIRRHRVAEHCQHSSTSNFIGLSGAHRKFLKKWRLRNVCGFRPVVNLTRDA